MVERPHLTLAGNRSLRVRRAYRVVSVDCLSMKLVAGSNRHSCRRFRFDALGRRHVARMMSPLLQRSQMAAAGNRRRKLGVTGPTTLASELGEGRRPQILLGSRCATSGSTASRI
jgi:hypothetical protein